MWLFGKKKNQDKTSKVKEENKKSQARTTNKAAATRDNSAKKTDSKPTKTFQAKENSSKTAKGKCTAAKTTQAKADINKKSNQTEKKSIYRVVYDKEARVWVIKKDGAKRNIATFATKEEALDRVKELSQSQELSFVVHKKDGKFQKKS